MEDIYLYVTFRNLEVLYFFAKISKNVKKILWKILWVDVIITEIWKKLSLYQRSKWKIWLKAKREHWSLFKLGWW